MNAKNQEYIDRLKARLRYSEKSGISELEMVRSDSRNYTRFLPWVSALFVIQAFRLLDNHFDDQEKFTFDYFVTLGLMVALAISWVLTTIRYKRSESCRSELEDELLQDNN